VGGDRSCVDLAQKITGGRTRRKSIPFRKEITRRRNGAVASPVAFDGKGQLLGVGHLVGRKLHRVRETRDSDADETRTAGWKDVRARWKRSGGGVREILKPLDLEEAGVMIDIGRGVAGAIQIGRIIFCVKSGRHEGKWRERAGGIQIASRVAVQALLSRLNEVASEDSLNLPLHGEASVDCGKLHRLY
jgi:hypothetical protein